MNEKAMPYAFLAPKMFDMVYQWLIERGEDPHIVVNCAVKGINVPVAYIKENHITLNLAMRAMADYHADADGMVFMMRFGGKPYKVQIPYNAIVFMFGKESGVGVPYANGGPLMPTDSDTHMAMTARGVVIAKNTVEKAIVDSTSKETKEVKTVPVKKNPFTVVK